MRNLHFFISQSSSPYCRSVFHNVSSKYNHTPGFESVEISKYNRLLEKERKKDCQTTAAQIILEPVFTNQSLSRCTKKRRKSATYIYSSINQAVNVSSLKHNLLFQSVESTEKRKKNTGHVTFTHRRTGVLQLHRSIFTNKSGCETYIYLSIKQSVVHNRLPGILESSSLKRRRNGKSVSRVAILNRCY